MSRYDETGRSGRGGETGDGRGGCQCLYSTVVVVLLLLFLRSYIPDLDTVIPGSREEEMIVVAAPRETRYSSDVGAEWCRRHGCESCGGGGTGIRRTAAGFGFLLVLTYGIVVLERKFVDLPHTQSTLPITTGQDRRRIVISIIVVLRTKLQTRHGRSVAVSTLRDGRETLAMIIIHVQPQALIHGSRGQEQTMSIDILLLLLLQRRSQSGGGQALDGTGMQSRSCRDLQGSGVVVVVVTHDTPVVTSRHHCIGVVVIRQCSDPIIEWIRRRRIVLLRDGLGSKICNRNGVFCRQLTPSHFAFQTGAE